MFRMDKSKEKDANKENYRKAPLPSLKHLTRFKWLAAYVWRRVPCLGFVVFLQD
ncbi:hypothetical protein PISMIDRAFT_678528 [Pisolithus microcarpus 441]|uniref:Uncharacterized protein n=1 Tax=Pisolithus microcarpus 441 TaxID=765257 RepID=A0A0C9YNB0_9AGAM|nr:hypothetical protein BKA83DRAFT_678528 [Pisolithus microcarpus]KIK11777.1 hypothetical protein PISMIDRAFT_690054 [Pisolithus microcarpus 441]KIK24047.1 hypothetical protein PISMIDRAFT_678528 [Pisolithus microcarpus 441]